MYFIDLLIGGIAGAASRTFTAPLELSKIQQQNSYMNKNIWNVYKNEGITKLWKGNGANVLRIFPQMGINYTVCKYLRENTFNRYNLDKNIVNFMSGAVSGSIAMAAIYPLENIRTRLSLQSNKEHYKGIVDVFKKTKMRKLYGGLKMSMLGFTPYNAFNFMFYHRIKEYLYNFNLNPHFIHLLAGGLSGSLAVTITYPTDLMRRRLQIQGMNESIPEYNGILDVTKKIYKTEGFIGYYRGLLLCYIKIFPSIAIQFYTIELLKETFYD